MIGAVIIVTVVLFVILFPCKISRDGRQEIRRDIQAFRRKRGGWRGWELT